MKPACTVSIIAHDLTIIVNADGFGQNGTGKIKQRVFPFFVTKKAMAPAAGKTKSRSQDTMTMVMPRNVADPARRWGLVFAIARPWKTVEDKAIKDLVPHLPRTYEQRVRVPRLPGTPGGKTFWG